jgi:hypothetical protein
MSVAAAACGGSTSPATPAIPSPTPTPAAMPTPAPVATPTPTPTPTPCTYGLCEAPTTNTGPVVQVILRLYTVQDPFGGWIPGWPDSRPIPVDYTVKLDVTGKDGYNRDTLGDKGVNIEFRYSDPSMVEEGGSHPWQRKLLVKKAGFFQARAVFDGVESNALDLYFTDK